MGRDRAALAAAAAAAQKMKKQSKAEKVSTSASSSAGKLCAPSSPQSIASTAASTPTLGVRPPELGRAGQPLPEPGLLSLPEGALEASDALKQASSANCAVCGEQVQQAAAGHVQFYSCENPHHSHSFLSCSDRCAKKFAKECSKPSEARRKLPLAKRQTGQLSCPRCHFLIVAGQVSQSSLAADGGAGVKPCVETQEPPPKASPPPARDAFVPAELLPSGGEHRASREPRSRTAPQEAGLADAEEPRQPRGGRRPAELLFIFPGETETSDPNQEPPRDPAVAVQQQQELEEARRTVAEVDGQLSELEERLAQLPGQKNRKERNELNQRIVALKNQPEVLAAQRLVRDPAAEWKRREREAKARGAEEERNEKVRDVVRWRLLEAIERSGDQCERAGEEHWAQLLREGRSSGLSESEEAMKAVQAVLDAIHEKQRLQEERQRSEEAAEPPCRRPERTAPQAGGAAARKAWNMGSAQCKGTSCRESMRSNCEGNGDAVDQGQGCEVVDIELLKGGELPGVPRRAPFELELVRTGVHWRTLGLLVSPDDNPKYLIVDDIWEPSLISDWNKTATKATKVQPGDIITAVNDEQVGGEAMLEIIQSSGKNQTLKLRIE